MSVPTREPIDFVLVPDAYAHKSDASTRAVAEFDPPRHVLGDIWVTSIEHSLSEVIRDACEPPGENYKPIRQGGLSYVFYRKNVLADGFDVDSALFHCVALSRIVHPTSIGFSAAGRMKWSSGKREIIPAHGRSTPSLLNPYAFVMAPHDDWLIPDDLPALRGLLYGLHAAIPLPRRVESALWYHEAAARHFFIDLRWPLLTTCLEGLVKIRDEKLPKGGRANSTKVFVDRLLAIGQLDVTLPVSENELRDIYDRRSLLSHGLAYGSLAGADKTLYCAQERLARGILRKIILDPNFRDIFVSDANIAARLPLR